jgi:GNAT superfamily N-acetyltransferase
LLPEWQGLGIGVAFSDAIAQIYLDRGLRYFSKTAHPALGEHREKSDLWRPTSTNRQSRKGSYLLADGTPRPQKGFGGKTTVRDAARVCYSHEYIGKKS